MKKSVKKNYIYNLIYQLIIIILPIITTPYLARTLGAESIGIYSYTISITTYFILLGSLGVAMYGQREISYALDDKKARTKVFVEILFFRIITMSISMIVFFFLFVRSGEYSTYYKILLLELVATCFDISWFFQGMEEFKKTVTRNSFIKIISIICIFTFIKSPSDVNKYLIIYVLSTLIGNLSLWLYLPKYTQKIKIKDLNIVQHIRPTIALFIPQIAVQIYTVLDKTMIGSIISDKSEVGYYEQAQKIIKILLTIITSLGTVMVPRMASIFKQGEKEKLKEYMMKTFNFVWILSIPMIFGIINISKYFVPIFFGKGYDKVSILMNIISPIFLIIGMSTVIGTQYFIPTKRQKEFTISVTIGAIINIVLNSILIKEYASIGASIATVFAEIAVTSIQLFFIRKEIKIFDILKMSRNYILAGIIMFAVNIVLDKFLLINLRDIINLIVQLVVGALIYVTVLMLLKDKFLGYIFGQIKGKFKNQKNNKAN